MITDTADIETDTRRPLPFHRQALARPGSSRWWRPFAALGTAAGLYAAACLVALVVLVALSLLLPSYFTPSESDPDPRNPADMVVLLGLIALMLPAVILGSRWGGGMRGAIHSVAGRVRWGLLLRAAAVVVPLYAVVNVIGFMVAPPADLAWPPVDARTILVIVIVLVLTPLQCAAEEYAFRAFPQQLLGTWLRSPFWGIVLPVPLFMIGHGYDWVGQIDLAVFSLCMGFLVYKSGGVELAVVVHTANNLTLFLLAPLSATSLQQGAVSPVALLVTVPLTLLVTAGLVRWSGRRVERPGRAEQLGLTRSRQAT